MTQFYGKYRGQVVDNNDPLKLGRIRALVPAVDRMTTNWALPCTLYADPHAGVLLLPPFEALVWIEFEAGDPNYPIWSGCFWERAEDMPSVVTPTPAK
jgi:Type VI secretion system/phage-baseplate injector OB domain